VAPVHAAMGWVAILLVLAGVVVCGWAAFAKWIGIDSGGMIGGCAVLIAALGAGGFVVKKVLEKKKDG
jgi:hypothetical protein